MLPKRKHFILLVIILLLFSSCATAQIKFPAPQGMVSDFSSKIGQPERESLEKKLKDFGDRSGIDVAVVLIPFDWLQEYRIEDYTRELGKQWGVGRGPEKLGLVLLVAIKSPDDKGIYQGGTRLEVSRNLEQDMPNDVAEEIIRRMRDDLKAGRFDNALNTGVDGIVAELARKRNIRG